MTLLYVQYHTVIMERNDKNARTMYACTWAESDMWHYVR